MTTATNKNFIQRFSTGFAVFLDSFGILRNSKKVFYLSLIPFFISVILAFVGFGWFYFQLSGVGAELIDQWMINFNDWLQSYNLTFLTSILTYLVGFVKVTLIVIMYLLLIPLIGVLILLCASILSIPANSFIAEEVLKQTGAYSPPKESLKAYTFRTLNLLRISLVKGLVLLLVALMILVVSILPIFSIPAVFLAVLIFAFDCVDYSLEVLNYNVRGRFKYLTNHFPELCGLALPLAVIFYIPVVQFMFIPIAVISGALLFKSEE